MSLASNSSETINVIIMQFGTVTASDKIMHQVLMILTLTFIQGHTYVNHESDKCSIISECVKAMPIKFAVKVVQLKVHIFVLSSMTLLFNQRHTCASILTNV